MRHIVQVPSSWLINRALFNSLYVECVFIVYFIPGRGNHFLWSLAINKIHNKNIQEADYKLNSICTF